MENNNYYVPDITEFRVGFEYEQLDKFTTRNSNNELVDEYLWSTYEITHSHDFYLDQIDENLGDILEEDDSGLIVSKIRVKYLSTQDIEELGFTLKHKVVDLWFEKEGTFESPAKEAYLYSKIFINYGLHDRYCKIRAKYASDNDEIELFRGTILNKSELIWILKRIGVL